jgi:hypothetical protein
LRTDFCSCNRHAPASGYRREKPAGSLRRATTEARVAKP